MKIVVTGGAGFIGSALVLHLVGHTGHQVVVVDKLTYAGNRASLTPVEGHSRFQFVQADICDERAMGDLFAQVSPDAVMHLAAESHVDRSIDVPLEFLQTNTVGTVILLRAAQDHWSRLDPQRKAAFRFHHISTDEVYGSLGAGEIAAENAPYRPNSPYAASKAASDHFVRSWHHTYGLPVVVTNCSNNYGPRQFPEKFIPLMILNALEGKPLPVYGDGMNIRDWLHVEDHARALTDVLERGRLGEVYNVGGDSTRDNLSVVQEICDIVDELVPASGAHERRRLVTFVSDRPGHDFRYAIDCSKLKNELGWRARESLGSGLRKTVQWYLANRPWWEPIRNGVYQGQRLGLRIAP